MSESESEIILYLKTYISSFTNITSFRIFINSVHKDVPNE